MAVPIKRRKLTLSDKLSILSRQAFCPVCGEMFGDLRNVDWDHEQALARGGADTNDNIRAICRDSCHRKKTSGTKATSTGSDIHEIAKTKRLTKDHDEFVSRLLSRECGEKREKTGKIKSRGFEKRKKKA